MNAYDATGLEPHDAWLVRAAQELQGWLGQGRRRDFTATERRVLVAWRAIAAVNGVDDEYAAEARDLTRTCIEHNAEQGNHGRYLVFTTYFATVTDDVGEAARTSRACAPSWLVDLDTCLAEIVTFKAGRAALVAS